MSPGPARGYSWPGFDTPEGRRNIKPAPHGHWRSLRHGATSPRKVEPLARELVSELSVVAPWVARPAYAATVAAWAWAEAQAWLLRTYLDENGLLDGDGVPRPAMALLEKVESRAANLRSQLALEPLSLARLLTVLDSAPSGTDDDGLEKLKREGRRIVEARATGDGDPGVTEEGEAPS